MVDVGEVGMMTSMLSLSEKVRGGDEGGAMSCSSWLAHGETSGVVGAADAMAVSSLANAANAKDVMLLRSSYGTSIDRQESLRCGWNTYRTC